MRNRQDEHTNRVYTAAVPSKKRTKEAALFSGILELVLSALCWYHSIYIIVVPHHPLEAFFVHSYLAFVRERKKKEI